MFIERVFKALLMALFFSSSMLLIASLAVKIGTKDKEPVTEVNQSPIELKVDGLRYACQINDSSDDGKKEAYLCRRVGDE